MVAEDARCYTLFVSALKSGDDKQRKQCFLNLIEVSMKIMEKSDTAFYWIRQLYSLKPEKTDTHLRVAAELLMGAVRGTFHVVSANLENIRSEEKKENYYVKLRDLYDELKNTYRSVMTHLEVDAG
jgi:formiminotetrahydrofolate cyclodeaminase